MHSQMWLEARVSLPLEQGAVSGDVHQTVLTLTLAILAPPA